jgi:AcrR family transcriptional regulator
MSGVLVRDRRAERRQATIDEILAAAWELVREEGVAALSVRGLGTRVGMRAQSLYVYFPSKHAIYDAMFAQANTELLRRLQDGPEPGDPITSLHRRARAFVEFCTEDPARYQLLFQRTIPGFEPSPEAYAPAVRFLANTQELLALNGVTEARHLDLWTALITGLVDQQVSNDPGGDRWTGLIDESIDMFLAHCQQHHAKRKPSSRPNRTKGPRS